MEQHYLITRGVQSGKQLTPSQRTSSLFSEEPVVLGQVLRRGSGPIKVSLEAFERNKTNLLRLEKAGSIVITPPKGTDTPEPEKVPEAPPAEPPKEPEKAPEPEKVPEEVAPETPIEPPAEEPSTTPPSTEETASAAPTEKQSRKKGRKE